MTPHEFRKTVKQRWPHVKVKLRTVSFQDLARASAICLTLDGDKSGECAEINALAKLAGIVPDGNIRFA